MIERLKCWLRDEDIEKIHQNTLEVLWERGMQLRHEKALALLQDAGAKYDPATHMVRFPPELVEKCLATVPVEITMGARFPEQDIQLGLNELPYLRTSSGAEGYLDLHTGEYRLGTNQDLVEWARLADSLENVHICGGHYPIDAPAHVRDVLAIKTLLENNAKHLFVNPFDLNGFKAMVDMAATVRGSREELKKRPLLTILTSATAPGQILEYCADVIMYAGEHGIPVEVNSAPLMGGTAPVTIAGIILQNNIEILSLAVISQLANPGAPLLYRGITLTMDMSHGAGLIGTVECGLAQAATAQLVRSKYNLPVVSYGPISDAKLPDGQCQIERTSQTLMAGMTGSQLLLAAGFIEALYTVDPVQLTIDNEMIGNLYRVLRGVDVDDDTLAKDVIMNTAPGGNYLTHAHTLKHFRKEHHIPRCFNRKSRAGWLNDGGKDMVGLARERAIKLVSEYDRAPLDDGVLKEMSDIYEAIAGENQ